MKHYRASADCTVIRLQSDTHTHEKLNGDDHTDNYTWFMFTTDKRFLIVVSQADRSFAMLASNKRSYLWYHMLTDHLQCCYTIMESTVSAGK